MPTRLQNPQVLGISGTLARFVLKTPVPFGTLALPATKFYCIIIVAYIPPSNLHRFHPLHLILPFNITIQYHAAPDISTI